MQSLKEKIAEAEQAMDKCFENCSEYSCQRMGECTGGASKALDKLKAQPKLQD